MVYNYHKNKTCVFVWDILFDLKNKLISEEQFVAKKRQGNQEHVIFGFDYIVNLYRTETLCS